MQAKFLQSTKNVIRHETIWFLLSCSTYNTTWHRKDLIFHARSNSHEARDRILKVEKEKKKERKKKERKRKRKPGSSSDDCDFSIKTTHGCWFKFLLLGLGHTQRKKEEEGDERRKTQMKKECSRTFGLFFILLHFQFLCLRNESIFARVHRVPWVSAWSNEDPAMSPFCLSWMSR